MQIAQTIQNEMERKPLIEHERGRSSVAGMVMKTCSSMAAFVAVMIGMPFSVMADYCAGRVSGPTFLPNGNLVISFSGIPGCDYTAETTDSLILPVTWTPVVTNTADWYGFVEFTNTPVGSQKFYRVSSPASPPPLVYAVEKTGKYTAPPPLPTLGNNPFIQPLPDPFAWANDPFGSTRSTNFLDWKCRRAEIQAQIEHYEIGGKPAVEPSDVVAAYAGGVLTVTVTRTNGGQGTLTLTCPISVPSGSGPFPAIIGMTLAGGPNTGSLPSDIFSNCIQIAYLHNQVTEYAAGQQIDHTGDPFYVMYPEYNGTNSGQYAAWAWGVSRIIDGLYQVRNSALSNTLPIDLKRIAVTGCSYAGKMALFSGALDERVALTVAQESGGGGATSWRYSATQAGVEGLGQTDHSWFADTMFQYAGNNVSYLPEDHHELCAMVAPRALLVTGNTDYGWLSNPSCYVNSRACAEVYKTFGIGDRFGFMIDGGHGHCAFPAGQRPGLQAFVDKFLFGNTNVNTDVTMHPASYDSLDYAAWYQWWGTTNPVFPVVSNIFTITFEPECATVGTNWQILSDTNASNGKYVTINPALNNTSTTTPANNGTNAADLVVINFSVTNSQNYAVYGRCNNPTADDDSFFVRVDNGAWVFLNGLGTAGWQWVSFGSFDLAAGSHTLSIAYRENGAKLDKISISSWPFIDANGMGEPAGTLCP